MIWEVGKSYKTRSKYKARILAVDVKSHSPICSAVSLPNGLETVTSHYDLGNVMTGTTHGFDLTSEEWVEPEESEENADA